MMEVLTHDSLGGQSPLEHYEREGVGAGPDTWQDNMREVLLENTANRTIATEKDPRLCFWFSFWLSKTSRSDDSHSGKKCHRHLAQQTSPQTLLGPAPSSHLRLPQGSPSAWESSSGCPSTPASR